MGTRSKEGLAALCLVANGFRAESFAEERVLDGRISEITYGREGGKHVVRVYSGLVSGHYTRGTSEISETDARSQALQAFWGWELEQAAMRPGDAVQLGAECF